MFMEHLLHTQRTPLGAGWGAVANRTERAWAVGHMLQGELPCENCLIGRRYRSLTSHSARAISHLHSLLPVSQCESPDGGAFSGIDTDDL